ncbi:polysaccharide transporter, PST family [Thermotomaculum hydrothermale]|uniref:Polysaccharide transporter, PST family n=1 Tax=Thermotomaculum hydrothermale TaxID=981385 RepID=A0A7R6SXL9_9BACT|nr:oligosaccharide flippase family protein [Thermotomaculum hydrothermale]BBB31690.1 polysaccharide transporter, PST family [Thermotomaculum hydrothermale]
MPDWEINYSKKETGVKRVFKNMFSLFFLRGSLHFLHFITYPFLMRMLGVERFGLVVFGQSIIMFFSIITDFGFNLSAVKEVSIKREDSKEVNEIFVSVFWVKLLLALFSLFFLLLLVNYFPKFKTEKLFFLLMYGYLVGYVLFPIWFFQGMEDMKYITYFNLLGRVVYTVLLFVFVRKPEHYILVPLFLSFSMILTGVSSFMLALKKYRLKLYFPRFSVLVNNWKKSFHFFLSNLFISMLNYSNVIFLGLFLGNEAAGLYSMAEKIYQALSSLYVPLNDALYPYMAKFKNFSFFKKVFNFSFLLNLIFLFIVAVFSREIILIMYGKAYVESIAVLRILSLSGAIWLPSLLIGYPLLGVTGKEKLVNNSIIFASIIHIALLLTISNFATVTLVAMLFVFTQIVILSIRLYGLHQIRDSLS